MAMVDVDSGSLYRWRSVFWLVLGSAAAWRHSTFIKWTGWTLAVPLPCWHHHKHCLGIIIIIIAFFLLLMLYYVQTREMQLNMHIITKLQIIQIQTQVYNKQSVSSAHLLFGCFKHVFYDLVGTLLRRTQNLLSTEHTKCFITSTAAVTVH